MYPYIMILGGAARLLALENFAFGELELLNFRPFFSLNSYVYDFWSFHALRKKILHLVS